MPANTVAMPPGAKLLSVSELTSQVRQLLEDAFPTVWLSAEISNLKYHANGHIYFSLKDANAQLGSVIWKSTAYRLRFELKDGMEVIAHGRISVYPPQGKYQLAIDEIQPKGIGALELAFQQLKEKLGQRGWFDPGRKRPLPRFPQRIAIVTSPSGAAIRDMLRIIPRRWPSVEIWVCPALVQGPGAAVDIVRAIRSVNALGDLGGVDVLIVGRGGGSLEDLWAFNEEPVAEAIFQSRIPIISAVGHEVDVTIADFVADRRAATPSEAAEIVVPDQVEFRNMLDGCRRGLTHSLERRIAYGRRHLDALFQRRVLRDPLQRLRDREQLLSGFEDRLKRATRRFVDQRADRLQSVSSRLEGLSPLNVLGRGYSLTRKADDGELLRSADTVQPGERVVTRLNRGEVISRVEETHVEDSPS